MTWQIILSNIITVLVAVLGSNGLVQFYFRRKWEREDKKEEDILNLEKSVKVVQTVVDQLLYHLLADKLEYYRVRGWADDTDRNEIEALFTLYKDRGFNGNMDSRMRRLYDLPMSPEEERKK